MLQSEQLYHSAFPVFLYYSPDFQEISVDFDADFLLSMIKTNEEDGTPYSIGRDVLKDIIYKRVDSTLITDQALNFAIDKSGGILRQIFYMLENGALEALTQGKTVVDIEHVKLSYMSLKNTFVRALKTEYIDCLNEIIHEPKLFGNNEILMKLLRSLIVIEYNGERWCGVNPIVLDIMRERGLVSESVN